MSWPVLSSTSPILSGACSLHPSLDIFSMIKKLLFITLLSWVLAVSARGPIQKPFQAPVPGASTPHGCYSMSTIATTKQDVARFNSPGLCTDRCRSREKAVAILQRDLCICTDLLPAASAVTKDSGCNYPCPGYAMEACGGKEGTVSVWNTGLKQNIPNAAPEGFEMLSSFIFKGLDLGKEASVGAYNFFCTYFNCRSSEHPDESDYDSDPKAHLD